jgi:hypothetical protein
MRLPALATREITPTRTAETGHALESFPLRRPDRKMLLPDDSTRKIIGAA